MTDSLPVVESFHSIQGEGTHAGKSAFFIRLAGCKIKCSWCDTKESWSFHDHPQQNVSDLAKKVVKARERGALFLVITGGEPLHHNLEPLCKAINEETSIKNSHPLSIHLETSGVHQISGRINWITLSPKKHYPPRQDILDICQELKVIIHNKEDIRFAKEMAKKIRKNENSHLQSTQPYLFLQPGWNNDEGRELAIEFVKKNPHWRLSMQTHKWLGIT